MVLYILHSCGFEIFKINELVIQKFNTRKKERSSIYPLNSNKLVDDWAVLLFKELSQCCRFGY